MVAAAPINAGCPRPVRQASARTAMSNIHRAAPPFLKPRPSLQGLTLHHPIRRGRQFHWDISAIAAPEAHPTGPRVLFAAGGTGGHVYPAIAIADAILGADPTADIHFAGTAERMEGEAVPKAGYGFHAISAVSVQRPLASLENIKLPFKLLGSLWQCYQLLGEIRPQVVVGTGGYISAPTCLAAALRGVPVAIQEQNAYAGLANRLIGRFAALVMVAFPEAQKAFPKGKSVVLGNPVRRSLQVTRRGQARLFFEVSAEEAARVAGQAFKAWANTLQFVCVMGGSLGATAINRALEGSGPALVAPGGRHILWQTGRSNYEGVQERMGHVPALQVVAYLDRVDLAYAASDLVVARAGAITCSELLVTGTPSVLVPSPNVAEDHQTKNARAMEAAGASVVLEERDLTPERLESLLACVVFLVLEERDLTPESLVGELLGDPGRLERMAAAARAAAAPEAADRIAAGVLALAGGGKGAAAAEAAAGWSEGGGPAMA